MDQLREMINETSEEKFKTSLFGFSKKEVLDYIYNLDNNMKNSIYNYERKISEISNSLTMALREKDNISSKADELNEKVKTLSVDIDEQKSSLVAENNQLKMRIEELNEYESRNELLITEMVGLKSRCEFAESERQGLLEQITEKEEIITEQCRKNAESERILKNQLEKLKTQYESVRKVQLLNINNAKENINKLLSIVEQL